MRLLIAFVVLIIGLFLTIFFQKQNYILSPFYGGTPTVTWFRSPTCKYQMNAILRQTLENNQIKSSPQGELMFPCSYNYTSNEIQELLQYIKPGHKSKKMYIIGEGDQISNKMSLWVNLRKRFGLKHASQMMPMTYVLYEKDDMERFKLDYNKRCVYIMKKNVQRQNGLNVTRDSKVILEGSKSGFVIVQKMLQDPYLIERRKINIRIYMLVVCQQNKLEGYMHSEGFVYYTRKAFKPNSTNSDRIITTGYIDRSVYERNPLTLGDLRRYLDDPDRSKTQVEKQLIDKEGSLATLLFKRIAVLLHDTVDAVKPKVCQNPSLKKHLTFQLYGVDLAINDKLRPSLMEINKGPDMGGKDGRDKALKTEVTNDIFKVVKVIPDSDHNFIKIYGGT